MSEATTPQSLSARAIFNLLMQKKTIRVPADPGVFDNLLNHLNVIKSREQKLFASLGLDYVTSIYNVIPVSEKVTYDPNATSIKELGIIAYDIKLIPKPATKKYPIYEIKEN